MSVWARLKRAKMRAWVLSPGISYKEVRAFVCSFDGGLYFLLKSLRCMGSAKGGTRYLRLWLGKLRGQRDRIVIKSGIEAPHRSNSVAIVVTFNPDAEVMKNLELHALNFERVVIVDNSIGEAHLSLFDHLPGSFQLIKNQNRFGLAGALNQGLAAVCDQKPAAWIFFFDQDTTIDAHFLPSIQAGLKNESPVEMLRTIYGVEHDPARLKRAEKLKKSLLEKVNSVITSGCFLRQESVLGLGPYIKEMFIDSLDHEYCLRAKRNGYRVKRVNLPLMHHRLGNAIRTEVIAGWGAASDNHAAFRWYYFTRNLIFVGIEGFPSSFLWVLSHGFGLFKYMVKVILFEKNAAQKVMAAASGFKDGAFNRLSRN